MKLLSTAAAMALLVSASASQAVTTFNFTYNTLGGPLSGQLTGTLQADNNTVVVSSVLDFVTFNGTPTPSLPFTNSVSAYLASALAPGIVTLDGSVMNIIACTSTACFDGFLLDTTGTAFGSPVFASSDPYGGGFESYVASAWSLSAAGVPEPASWAMMITGFALVGSALRRRRVAATA